MRFVQAGVLLLGAASYLGLCMVMQTFNSRTDGAVVPLIIGGWMLLLLVVAALVIVDSVRKARAGKTAQLARDLYVVKLAAIPLFSINFIVLATIGLFGSAVTAALFASAYPQDDFTAFGGEMLGIFAIAIALTYLAMLTTSTYGWATIAQLRRDGRIGSGMAALYRVMLLLFVLDVVAGILLYARSRREEVAQ